MYRKLGEIGGGKENETMAEGGVAEEQEGGQGKAGGGKRGGRVGGEKEVNDRRMELVGRSGPVEGDRTENDSRVSDKGKRLFGFSRKTQR